MPQSDFNLTLVATQEVEVAGQQVSITLQSAGPTGSLTATTTPANEKNWKGTIAVNGTVEIDLTALVMEIEVAGETVEVEIDFTGLKVLQAKFRTALANGAVLCTVAPGDTNGYPIGTRPLEGNGCDGFFRPHNSNEVGPTSKKVKFTSLSAVSIEVVLVAGE